MKISIASGKGGTGKTMVATGLALSLAARTPEQPPLLVDCDVEAPNAHLFLHPKLTEKQDVALLIPAVDDTKCTSCGECAKVCQFHAIVVLGKKTLVFPQLCHGCGSCTLVCPEAAIHEIPDRMGILERGVAEAGVWFAHGVLDIGEPMAVPVIRQLKKWVQPSPGQVALYDCPPGTSCPVVESVRGSDYLLLVTEPTPFGLHDLRLAVQVASELGIPCGVIVNRARDPYPPLEEYCSEKNLPVWLRIPFDRAIAEGLAQGKSLIEIHPHYSELFCQVFEGI